MKKRVRYPLFRRTYHCFKNNHFDRNYLFDQIILPYQAVMHDIGDINNEDVEPDLKTIDRFIEPGSRILLFNSTLLNMSEFENYKVPTQKFRIVNTGVSSSLMRFKSANQERIKLTELVKIVSERRDLFSVVNHRPVKRVRLTGPLKTHRTIMHVYGTVFDRINKIEDDCQHYIPIKVEGIYEKTNFLRIMNRGFNISSIDQPDSSFYLFLSNLILFASNENMSIPLQDTKFNFFNYLDESKINRVNFIFYTDKTFTIYSLTDIIARFSNGQVFIQKFLKQLEELFSLSKDSFKNTDIPEEDLLEDPNDIIQETVPIKTKDKSIQESNKLDDKKTQISVNRSKDNLNTDPVIHSDTIDDEHGIHEKSDKIVSDNTVKENKKDRVVVNLNSTNTDTKVTVQLNSSFENKPKIELKKPEPRAANIIKENMVNFYCQDTYEKIKSTKESVYTKAQMEKLERLANSYKSITVDNVPLMDIINSCTLADPIQKVSLDHLKDDVFDSSFLESSILDFNNNYVNKYYERSILLTALSVVRSGHFLTGISKEVVKNKSENYTMYTFNYENADFEKNPPVKLKIQNINEDGTIISRGSKKKISNQRINKTICKISDTRVALNGDFSKSIVEWKKSSSRTFLTTINKLINGSGVITKSGTYTDNLNKYPLELSLLASKFQFFKTPEFTWDFNLSKIKYNDSIKAWLLGVSEKEKLQFFINMKNELLIYKEGDLVNRTFIVDFISEHVNKRPMPFSEFIDVTILGKNIPMAIVLAYRFGLKGMLDLINAKYDLYEIGSKGIPNDSNLIKIKFADQVLVFDRYPYDKSLILAGLTAFNLSLYSFEDLNDRDIYYTVFEQKGISPNYLRGIDNFFDFFIDPTTYECLVYMKEPTTVEGLFQRAVEMLSVHGYFKPASAHNFRVRSYNKVSAIMYHELVTQISKSRSNILKSGKISVNPEAVFQRVLQDALTDNIDVNNPIGNLKDKTVFSYVGHGGRTEESFVIKDREYVEDNIGIISEANIDSGSVAFRAFYTMNPNITNMAGMEEPVEDIKQLGASNILSVSSLIFPTIMCDDSKRVSMASIQISQTIPVATSHFSRVRTSYERVVPYLVSYPFTFVATKDGTIIENNKELKILKIKYDDGEMLSISYGELISRYSAAGLFITQSTQTHSLLGKTFKKNDILVYNENFFGEDPYSCKVVWKLGQNIKVALVDKEGTQEDSNIITRRLSEQMAFKPIHEKQIILSTENSIVKFADVGTIVSPITPLIIFEDSDQLMDLSSSGYDDDTINLIQKLNRKTPKADFTGVVKEIQVIYKTPLENMSKTMRDFITHVEKKELAISNFTKGSKNSVDKPGPREYIEKYGYVNMEEDTVIINYYIQDNYGVKHGDKVVFASVLKSVNALVLEKPLLTENGEHEVDGIFSGSGSYKRIINSAFLIGPCGIVLEALQKQTLKDYKKIKESRKK